MNYWIASYPRSGNTFLRILLKEVYGIYTWEGYGAESPKKVLAENRSCKVPLFIKTHELPNKTEIPHKHMKSIYLIRDGRDAMVSMAYHRSQIVNPGSNYEFNLRTVILSPFGTSFGGWSQHIVSWSKHADIIIRFEDLISHPEKELQKLEQKIGLPQGDYSKIPTFSDLKKKKYFIGSGNTNLSEATQQKRREQFFRSGKVNAWKENISKSLIQVLYQKHGEVLKQQGYASESKGTENKRINTIRQYILWMFGYIKEKAKR